MQRLSGKYTFGTASSRRVFYTRVRYAFLMLELCITIIIYHNAATLWQVHLRHCVLKESLLYTVRYAFLMLELCITIIIYHTASSRRVCQQNPIQCLFLWHCCYAAASTMLSTKIIKQQNELNKLVGQTVKRVMVLEQQLEQIQEKKNLQVHHVKKENVM